MLHLNKLLSITFSASCNFQKTDLKPKLLVASSAAINKPVEPECLEEDFYSMFERINSNVLSDKDMKRCIAAMKEVSVLVLNIFNADAPRFDTAWPHHYLLIDKTDDVNYKFNLLLDYSR